MKTEQVGTSYWWCEIWIEILCFLLGSKFDNTAANHDENFEDQAKREDRPRSNLDDLNDRNKEKIREKNKGKAVDSKYINVKVLKSMMPSKHHRIVTDACILILKKNRRRKL